MEGSNMYVQTQTIRTPFLPFHPSQRRTLLTPPAPGSIILSTVGKAGKEKRGASAQDIQYNPPSPPLELERRISTRGNERASKQAYT